MRAIIGTLNQSGRRLRTPRHIQNSSISQTTSYLTQRNDTNTVVIPLIHSSRRAKSERSRLDHRTSVTQRSTISTYQQTTTMAELRAEPPTNGVSSAKPVFFFDIDNCLYPKSTKVHDLMADLIDKYFQKHLDLPAEEATRLHNEYYQTYGLAIEGLVRHHEIDPLEYNSKVDDALPLENLIKPRPELQQLLEDIDDSKVRLWLFTNAYINHAQRVVRLLGVEDKFEGVTFCDYSKVPFVCKPHEDAYVKAMKEAGVAKWENCYFVDDSYINCVKAQELGWNTAHLVEDEVTPPKKQASQFQIRHLEDLRAIFPQFFKAKSQ